MSHKIIPTKKPVPEIINAGALAVYAQPMTLTTSEQPMSNLVVASGFREENGEPTDYNATFGLNGSNLVIKEPGLYSVITFTEFTNIPDPAGYLGVRLYQVGGGLTRRLWLNKSKGAKPEYAGSIDATAIVTSPMELQVVAMVRDAPDMNLSRVYVELTVKRLGGLVGSGPIS